VSITITITAQNAAEVAQLVHDLAGTISRMSPSDIPAHTEVSTIDPPVASAPTAPSAAPVPVAAEAPTAAPQAPAAVPVAPQQTGVAPAAVPTATPTGAPQSAVPTATAAPLNGVSTVPVGSANSAPAGSTAAQQQVPTAPQPVAPTSVPEYTYHQIATATMQLQQAGQNVHEIFAQFGIQALNQLPKERYGEYAAFLRQRGAKI
jgi:hypothetical protein